MRENLVTLIAYERDPDRLHETIYDEARLIVTSPGA
jgi:hypothetical protein